MGTSAAGANLQLRRWCRRMVLLDLVVEDGQAVDHEPRETRQGQLLHVRIPSNAVSSGDGQAEDDGKHLLSTLDEVSCEATASSDGLMT